jgi:hypothetical protein
MVNKKLVPKIKGLKATGSAVLVELLNEEEILGTTLELVGSAIPDTRGTDGAPQAYVLGAGPGFNSDTYGFKVGDRIMFSGPFIPAPAYDKHFRVRGTIEPHAVKAVLSE